MTNFVRRTVTTVPVAVLVVVAMLVAVGARSASASTTYTVERTIHLPFVPLVNACNGDKPILEGDQHIRVRTTTRDDGTVIVNSLFSSPNLKGRTYPVPPDQSRPVKYTGANTEQDYSYLAVGPYPDRFRILHWTKLVPQGGGPTMYLVTVFSETVYPTAPAVVTADNFYLVCQEPCSHEE